MNGAVVATVPTPTPATGASCGDVCSGHGYGPVNVTAATPATGASCGDVCSGHGYGPVNVTAVPPAIGASCGDVCSGHGYGSSVLASVVRIVTPRRGFDGGDAGIGAVSMLVLTAIAFGGVLATTNRRSRRAPRRDVSATS
ncbi:MAG: hypothetical protein ACXVUE_24020 [Solirubrobacteraceae bacterium]